MYRITKTLSKGFRSTDVPVKDQQGNTISKEEENQRCQKEHFEKVTEATITPAPAALISTDPPSVDEVRRATKSLKNRKAWDILIC